eukprot:5797017-Pleurochrysis_carterae.AAC.2
MASTSSGATMYRLASSAVSAGGRPDGETDSAAEAGAVAEMTRLVTQTWGYEERGHQNVKQQADGNGNGGRAPCCERLRSLVT